MMKTFLETNTTMRDKVYLPHSEWEGNHFNIAKRKGICEALSVNLN